MTALTNYLDFRADWNAPDAVAAYDELSLWSSYAGRLLLDNVPMRPAMSVLDVGCGAGFPLLELAQRLGPDCRAVGVDTWREAFRRAALKQRVWDVRQASLVRADAVALPFAESSFDLVVSNLGLNNFDDPEAAMRECARVLRPGGRIAITTNVEGHMAEFYDVYAATLKELGMDAFTRVLGAHERHRSSVGRVLQLFVSVGLAVERIVEDSITMRFADGSSFFRHYFVRAAFLNAWREIVPAADRARVFEAVELRLNDIAVRDGELRLTVPLAYLEAQRSSA